MKILSSYKQKIRKNVNSIMTNLGITSLSIFDTLLDKRIKKTDNFFFIQIGANDGITHDDIYTFVTRNKVRGIVIEPLPDFFEKLVDNYKKHPQIKKINVAIHHENKKLELYRVNSKISELPKWSQGIASFDKEHHLKCGIPSKYIICEEVDCMSFDELIVQNNISYIDLLQIDTEGYDYQIIKMINFNQIKPCIIRFEHLVQHGFMSKNVLRECLTHLYDNGYFISMEKNDAIAYLPEKIF
jgi:FkbM family methyltransferase